MPSGSFWIFGCVAVCLLVQLEDSQERHLRAKCRRFAAAGADTRLRAQSLTLSKKKGGQPRTGQVRPPPDSGAGITPSSSGAYTVPR